MLKSHLDAVEKKLLASSGVAANAGHTLHRGTPRERFISEFLQGHLSGKFAIGTGEIIDANSLPRQQRNQFDIIIYKAEYPKIDLGGGISAFLAESVVATIEVKSLLTDPDLTIAVRSAATAKRLQRQMETSMWSGWVPPGIISIVVAYAGPAQIATVNDWLLNAEAAQGLNKEPLPPTGGERVAILCESVDAVICLGLGTILFDNVPIAPFNDQTRAQHPQAKRHVLASPDGNLMWLFLLLTQAGANSVGQWPNLRPYLQRINFEFVPSP